MSVPRDSRPRRLPRAAVVPLTVVLADVVDDALTEALEGAPGPCLWCGAADVSVRHADPVSGAVVAVCRACGSELSGVAWQRLREAAG